MKRAILLGIRIITSLLMAISAAALLIIDLTRRPTPVFRDVDIRDRQKAD